MKYKKQNSNTQFLIRVFLGLSLFLILGTPVYGQTITEGQGFGTVTSEPFPTAFIPINESDLANSGQSSFFSITDVDTGGRGDTVDRLFDGIAGVGSGFEAQFNTGSLTINFNTTVNTNGYDITEINTYAAWDNAAGGRSDQEYTLTVIYIDNTEEEIITGTHYENTTTATGENGEVNVWTQVKISNPTDNIATGVKALRFDFATGANAGGTATYTEFDIIGARTAIGTPRTFVHPGIGFTADDLNAIKANLNQEPWKTGYEDLLAQSQSSLSYVMEGPFALVGRTENANAFRSDMAAVHNMARLWFFTDNEAYAQKARDIMIAWATSHTVFDDGETYLTMGYEAWRVFEGADLLRGAWSGWTQSDTDICKAYFRDVWYDPLHLNVPSPMRSANQGMAQFASAINIAVFNDDEELFDQLVYLFRTDASCGLLSSLPNGQVGDTGRDAHDQGQISLWARSAETIWQQGVDLFSEYDNRILAAGEYLSRANLGLKTPFIQAGTVYDVYPSYHFFQDPLGGSFSIDPAMLTIIKNAYIVRKGMSSPYLEKYITFAEPEAETFTYLTPFDNSTAEAPPILSGPADVASVTSLNSIDMGDATGGSSSYNNETWTVNGRGSELWYNSDPDYHFAYLPITGDATIVAKLTSISGGSANDARAGLVFARNLNNDPDMATVFITSPEVQAQMFAFTRGDIAHSHPANDYRSYGRFEESELPPIPYWFKIERIANRITLYSSPDGVNWSTSHVADYSIEETAYFGLAVSSNDSGSTATATFTNVRITGGDGGEAIKAPEAPFAIYASRDNDKNEVSLRWLESFEADSYKIWRSTTPGGPYTEIAKLSDTTSHIDTDIDFCNLYYYAVSAVNSAGESPLSQEEEFHFVNNDWYEAEDYDQQSGVRLEDTADDFSGQNIAYLNDGDWVRYNDIPIESENAIFQVRAAGYNDDPGTIEIRIGSQNGTLIGSLTPTDTGRTQFWDTSETALTVTPGIYDLFLVFKNPSMNVNWFDIIIPDAGVIAHSDPNFEGPNYEFLEGQYSFSGNIKNNVISSLEISEGYVLEIFENVDFTGNSETFNTGNINCLEDLNFDNTISSIIITKEALSTNDLKLKSTSIFPNPILNTFTITGAKDSIIRIYNVNGRTLFTKQILNDSDRIDVSHLSSGLYFAEVLNTSTKSVIKIIKK